MIHTPVVCRCIHLDVCVNILLGVLIKIYGVMYVYTYIRIFSDLYLHVHVCMGTHATMNICTLSNADY